MTGKPISLSETINACRLWLNLDLTCFNTTSRSSSGALMPFCSLMLYYAMMQLAAEYVKDNDLDVLGSAELAKAIKDHERRPEGRQVGSFLVRLSREIY